MSDHDKVARTWLVNEFGPDADTTLVGMVESLCGLLASVEEEANDLKTVVEARLNEALARVAEVAQESTLRKRAWDLCEARVAELERERTAENFTNQEAEKQLGSERDSARALNARLREALEGVERHCAEALACETCHPINHCPILDNVRKTLAESASDASEWTREVERRVRTERDRLFCESLIATLGTIEIERVTRYFNEHRPDQPDAGARAGEGGARE